MKLKKILRQFFASLFLLSIIAFFLNWANLLRVGDIKLLRIGVISLVLTLLFSDLSKIKDFFQTIKKTDFSSIFEKKEIAFKNFFEKKWVKWGLVPFLLFLFGISLSLFNIYNNKPFSVLTENYKERDLVLIQEKSGHDKEKIIGEFRAIENNLGIVSLELKTTRDNIYKRTLTFRIKEKGKQDWYYENEYDIGTIISGESYPFGFPTIPNSKNKTFIFEIEFPQSETNIVSLEGSDSLLSTKHKFSKTEITRDYKNLLLFSYKKFLNTYSDSGKIVSALIYLLLPLLYFLFRIQSRFLWFFSGIAMLLLSLTETGTLSFSLFKEAQSILLYITILSLIYLTIYLPAQKRKSFPTAPRTSSLLLCTGLLGYLLLRLYFLDIFNFLISTTFILVLFYLLYSSREFWIEKYRSLFTMSRFKKGQKIKKREKYLIVVFLVFLFFSSLFLKTYDFKERPMSDTGRYLFRENKEQNIDNYEITVQNPLPKERSGLGNRYNLCYLAYVKGNADLTKCHSSPMIIKSLATGFTFYNIMPLFNIPTDFFSQHLTFIILFHIVSFAFFIWEFLIIYERISQRLAYIFSLFLFTAPFFLVFEQYLNYDSFLIHIGILFSIYTYLFFKENRINDLLAITVVYFVGTTIKGFTNLLLYEFVILYCFSLFFRIFKHNKNFPQHFLFSISTIISGTFFLYLLIWPHAWIFPLETIRQHILYTPANIPTILISLSIIFVSYIFLKILDKIKIKLPPKYGYWLVFLLTVLLSLISYIKFPISRFINFKVFEIFNINTSFFQKLFFSLPIQSFTNNILIVLFVSLGLALLALNKKSNKLKQFFIISFLVYLFFILLSSGKYPSHNRYQHIVSGCFILSAAIFFSSITKKFHAKTLFLLLFVFYIFAIREIILFIPHLFFYKNQIAPAEFYPTTGSGMQTKIDAFRFLENLSNKSFVVYVNYPGGNERNFSKIKLLNNHGKVPLAPQEYISFDYAIFTTSGKNGMYVRPIVRKIYNLYQKEKPVWKYTPPRYKREMISIKEHIPLTDIEEKLVSVNSLKENSEINIEFMKNQLPDFRKENLKVVYHFYYDQNSLERIYSGIFLYITKNNGAIKVYLPKEIYNYCPNILENNFRKYLTAGRNYLFVNSQCNFEKPSLVEAR